MPLFAACSKRELQIIARHMQVVAVPREVELMREGEQGDAFFVVIEGTAAIVQKGHTTGAVGPGDHVGELALLDPAPRSATVFASTPMMVGVIDARAFAAILRDVPPLSSKLLRSLARRLRERDLEAAAR